MTLTFHIQRFDDVLKCKVWLAPLLLVNGSIDKLLVKQQQITQKYKFEDNEISTFVQFKVVEIKLHKKESPNIKFVHWYYLII